MGLIPGLGRSPGERRGNPLQYSCLENPMDSGALWAKVHGVARSWAQLKWLNTHTHIHTHTHTHRVSISPSSASSLWMLVCSGLSFGASYLCLHIFLVITYSMRFLISLATSVLFHPFHSVKWNTSLLAVSAKILRYSTFYLVNYIQFFGKIISRCWAPHY